MLECKEQKDILAEAGMKTECPVRIAARVPHRKELAGDCGKRLSGKGKIPA